MNKWWIVHILGFGGGLGSLIMVLFTDFMIVTKGIVYYNESVIWIINTELVLTVVCLAMFVMSFFRLVRNEVLLDGESK
jgi:hypothetical protein